MLMAFVQWSKKDKYKNIFNKLLQTSFALEKQKLALKHLTKKNKKLVNAFKAIKAIGTFVKLATATQEF